MTDKQRDKIKQKIRSLRSKLNAEKRKYGWYDDSYGKRYLIGNLYVQLGDYRLAKKYFDWFDQEFPDDIGFPQFNFGRVKTLFVLKKEQESLSKLIEVEANNSYLIDILLERTKQQIEKREWSNLATLEYAKGLIVDCERIMTEEFKDWLEKITSSTSYQDFKRKHLELEIQLSNENSIEKRKEILRQIEELVENWKTNV